MLRFFIDLGSLSLGTGCLILGFVGISSFAIHYDFDASKSLWSQIVLNYAIFFASAFCVIVGIMILSGVN